MHIRYKEISGKLRFSLQCGVKPWSNGKLLCWRHLLQLFDCKRLEGDLNSPHSIVLVVNFPSRFIPLYLADVAVQPSPSHIFNLRHYRNLHRTTYPCNSRHSSYCTSRNSKPYTGSRSSQTTTFKSTLNHWLRCWWPWFRRNSRIPCILHHEAKAPNELTC